MTEPIIGNCSRDDNPDAWYPTVPQGGNWDSSFKKLVPMVHYAINLCNTCPKAVECQQEGLKHNNLAHGIWGGLLPAERIAMVDARGEDYMADPHNTGRKTGLRKNGHIDDTHKLNKEEKEDAIRFLNRIKPFL